MHKKWQHDITTKQKNDKGTWHSFDIAFDRLLDQGNEKDIAIFNSAKTFAETVSKGEAKVSQERGEGNATTTEEAVPF